MRITIMGINRCGVTVIATSELRGIHLSRSTAGTAALATSAQDSILLCAQLEDNAHCNCTLNDS